MSDATPRPSDADHNLLFGVLALQADLLDAARFTEACAVWAARKDLSLADLLVERGWITSEDRTSLDRLLQRKLQKYHGDARSGLAGAMTPEARQILTNCSDSAIQEAAHSLPPPEAPQPITVAHQAQSRDRYTLLRLHAKGGIGQVWLARDSGLCREVALKELLPDRAGRPDLASRFLTEAQVTGQLEHPGIVPIYELVQSTPEHRPFYTMRFVRGRTLAQAVRTYHHRLDAGETRALDLRELLTAFVAVCNTVAYAHARGVVHRDLKGSNVALGDYGEVMVLDWGLARLLALPELDERAEPGCAPVPPVRLEVEGNSDPTRYGQVLGTPAYMSPEQAQGRHDLIDGRSDVYSLGAILYEILAGRAPFSGSTEEILNQVIHESPPPPRRLVPAAPGALEAVCLKAMSKRPEDRYPSATALADEVRHWLAGEPVTAWREPLAMRARRWLGRHRTLMTSAVAALAVAVVSLATATVLLSRSNERERRERDRARANFVLARDAVDRYCTRISDDPRLKEKDLEELRRQLLQTAAEFYETFAEQEQDDPDLRAELGRAHRRLAYISADTGGPLQALASCEKSIQVLEALCADKPGEPTYQQELAQSHGALGSVLRDLGRFQQAAEANARAREICAVLVRDHPRQTEYTLELGKTHTRFGYLSREQGSYQEAVVYFQRASLVLEPVHDHEPDNETCLTTLANVYEGLAISFRRLGRLREGEETCLLALPLREKLMKLHPGQALYESYLASTVQALALNQQSALRRARGPAERTKQDAKKCLDNYHKALALARHMVAGHPTVAWSQRELATLLGNIALFHQEQGQLAAAQRRGAEAVAILKKLVARYPEVPDYREGLFRMHANQSTLHVAASNLDKSAEELRQAKALFGTLAGQPKAGARRGQLALNWSTLGRMYLLVGQPGPAQAAFREVEALLRDGETSAEHKPEAQARRSSLTPDSRPLTPDSEAQSGLIESAYSHLGQYYSQTERHDRAAVAFSKAIALKKRIAARPQEWLGNTADHELTVTIPLNVRVGQIEKPPRDLPDLYLHLGSALVKSGRPREGVVAFEEAILEREKLCSAEPAKVSHSLALANDRLNLADAYRQDNQPSRQAGALREAAATLDKAEQRLKPESHQRAAAGFLQGRLGEAYSKLADRPRAEEAYRLACTLYEGVIAHHPDVADYQNKLATVETNLAVLAFKAGSYRDAIEIGGKAVARLRALVGKDPEVESYRSGLLNAQVNQAAAEHNAGLLDVALQGTLQALALLKQVNVEDPITASHANNLAGNSRNLSRAFAERKRFREAIDCAACSVEAAALLRAVHPGVAPYHGRCARALLALATALAESGLPAEANPVLGDAKAAISRMDRTDPNADLVQHELSGVLRAQGLAWTLAGNPDLAVLALRQDVAVRTRLADRWFAHGSSQGELVQSHLQLATALQQSGRLDESAESAHQALARLGRLSAKDRPVSWQLVQVGRLSKQLGDAQEARGNLPAVVRARVDSLTAWKQVVAAHPTQQDSVIELALARTEVAGVLWRAKLLRPARQELALARKALDGILKLDDDNQRARGGLALTLMFQAIVESLEGKQAIALRTFRQAVEIQENLVSDHPESVEARRQLAGIFGNLAMHHTNRKEPEQAVEVLRKQIAQLDALAQRGGSSQAEQVQRAWAEIRLAGALLEARALVKATRTLQKAQASLALFPSSLTMRARVEVGLAWDRLGQALQTVNPDRAEAAFAQARAIEEKLFTETRMAEYVVNLIGTYCNTGNFVRATGKPEAALGWYDRGIRASAALSAKEARQAQARLYLRNTRLGRAEALEQLKRYEKAAADWSEVIRLDTGAERDGFVYRLARCLANAGRHEQAGIEAEKLALRRGPSGVRLYLAACVLGLASSAVARDPGLTAEEQKKLSDRYASRAVELLLGAREAGWFKKSAAIDQMRTNADLVSLRTHEGYKKLLQDLAAVQ